MIRLKTKHSEAGLIKDGACLTHFTHEGIDILRPNKPFKQNPLNAACFPCAPYFGRIAKGVPLNGLSSTNTQYWALSQTHPDIDMPIHGEAWMTPWQDREVTATYIALTQHSKPSAKGQYPFSWHTTKTLKLEEHSLSIELALKNTHPYAAPFGLGLHPFFPRFPNTQLQFEFKTLHTPPEFSIIPLTDNNFKKGARLPDYTIDHSFVHWSGRVTITGQQEREITLISDAPYLHLYAPKDENFFCLEPITQLPGAFANMSSIASLMIEPEQTKTVKMTIEVK